MQERRPGEQRSGQGIIASFTDKRDPLKENMTFVS
jgi:hypothetical protein